jgi:uncharacterized protein (UPF0218 family)
MEVNELLAGFASLASKDADGFLSTLKDESGEFTATPEEIFNHVKTGIQERLKETGKNQLKRGQSELKREVIETVKGLIPDLELDDDAIAADYVKALYEKVNASKVKEVKVEVPGEPAKITPELLESDPVAVEFFKTRYHSKLEEKQKEAEAAKAQYEAKTKELVLSARKAKIDKLILEEVEKQRVRLDVEGDEDVDRAKRIKYFLKDDYFKPEFWREDEEGRLYPIDEKGNRRQTDDFHDAEMADLINEINPFGYIKRDSSKSSPQPPTTGTAPKGGSKIRFKDGNDFIVRMNQARTKEEKQALAAAWKAQQEQAA